MIQEEFKNDVITVIKDWFTNSGFKARKLTDTPTDALQVVNKRYCDANSGGVAGNDKDIQFNDGGVMGGDDNLQWDKNNGSLILGDGLTLGSVDIKGTDGDNVSKTPVSLSFLAGEGADYQAGGSIDFTTGSSATGGWGSFLNLDPGHENGDGGQIEITAGDGGSTSGDGGGITLTAGVTYGGVGGNVVVDAGNSDNASTAGKIDFNAGNGGEGGRIQILAGGSNADSTDGGVIQIQSGQANGATANGGNVNIYLGTGTTNRGRLNITGLPTSSAGLSSGDIWLNSNVLTIVP